MEVTCVTYLMTYLAFSLANASVPENLEENTYVSSQGDDQGQPWG